MSELMQKHEMTEEDIKLQFITPAIEAAGWDKFKQIKLEYNFTDGRVIVRGNVTARGKRKTAAGYKWKYTYGADNMDSIGD